MPSAPSTDMHAKTDWRWQHAHAARCLDDVERLFPGRFDLRALDRDRIDEAARRYGMRATPYYLDLARRADESDPVWALAVPSPRELDTRPEELADPIGDETPLTRPVPAITRRYPDRVLLMPTPVCSVHCRHCFRKRLVGNPSYAPDAAELDTALRWIQSQTDLREVILTGGDPLTLADDRVAALVARLDAIPHLRSLRVHSRMPVVNPFRVTDELADVLGATQTLRVSVVTHVNHANEITEAFATAVDRLRRRGLDVLNQAVLLAGLNDEAETQRELIWALHATGVRPYALHHADLVPGTAHRRTTIERGRALMRALRGTLPGPLLPVYLLDIPGGHGKVPLDHGWVTPGGIGSGIGSGMDSGMGEHHVEAPDGSQHDYLPASRRPQEPTSS